MKLYLGTSEDKIVEGVIHYPVIRIVPRSAEEPTIQATYRDLNSYTHWIFTSKNAVDVVARHLKELNIPFCAQPGQKVIAIGRATGCALESKGISVHAIPEIETQEGVVALLDLEELEDAYLFLPRSSRSRPVLLRYFMGRNLRFQAVDIYDTITQRPEIEVDMELVKEIIFTSPSTIEAFVELFGMLPQGKQWTAIGPVTQHILDKESQHV